MNLLFAFSDFIRIEGECWRTIRIWYSSVDYLFSLLLFPRTPQRRLYNAEVSLCQSVPNACPYLL